MKRLLLKISAIGSILSRLSRFYTSNALIRHKMFTFVYLATALAFPLRKAIIVIVKKYVNPVHYEKLWKTGILHGVIRSASPADRSYFNNALFLPKLESAGLKDKNFDLLQRVLAEGYVKFKGVLKPSEVANINNELDKLQRNSGQVWAQSKTLHRGSGFFCWEPFAVLKSPQLLNLLFRLDILQDMLKITSNDFSIYSINPYGAHQNTKSHYVQNFHRDFDGFLTFSFLILLSDCSAEDSATELSTSELENSTAKKSVFLAGKAGDVIAFDTFNYHRANLTVMSERRLVWLRFGEFPNGGVAQDMNWAIKPGLKEFSEQSFQN